MKISASKGILLFLYFFLPFFFGLSGDSCSVGTNGQEVDTSILCSLPFRVFPSG